MLLPLSQLIHAHNMEKLKSKKSKLLDLKDILGQSYILNQSENFEKFLQELGVKKNTRLQAIESKPTVTLSKVNGKYLLSTSYPEGKYVEVLFKPEEPIQRKGQRKPTDNSVFHLEGNKLTEIQQVNDLTVLIEREFKKKELVITMEVNDVKCTRTYVLLADSKHSIKTETSRRSYLWDSLTESSETSSEPSTFEMMNKEEEEEEEEKGLCY